ncbi:MAG: hypothetical protein ACPGWM_10465, partial [Flavobacteriales bacterium]
MKTFNLLAAFLLSFLLSSVAQSQSFPPQLSDFVTPCQPGINTVEDFLEQCTTNPTLLEVDVETCSWATGPNFQLGSQSVLSNNVWQIQNGGGLDLNGSCYLNIQSQGTASVTELVLNNLNLPNQALTISFDFGLQGTQNTQANLKLVMIPQGNNPQELWVLPLQDDDDFQNGPQHMEIPIPGNAQGATFLWVFEDQTQAPAGEVQVGIDNIRIQQLPDEPEPCELLYYDSNGNPNSLPFYLS